MLDRAVGSQPSAPPAKPRSTHIINVAAARRPARSAYLVYTPPDGSRLQYPVTPGRLVLGRDPESGIIVYDEAVSRTHAAIESAPGGWFRVVDLESTNGTYLNGARVTEGFLRNGDTLTLGGTELKFELV